MWWVGTFGKGGHGDYAYGTLANSSLIGAFQLWKSPVCVFVSLDISQKVLLGIAHPHAFCCVGWGFCRQRLDRGRGVDLQWVRFRIFNVFAVWQQSNILVRITSYNQPFAWCFGSYAGMSCARLGFSLTYCQYYSCALCTCMNSVGGRPRPAD
jgi:hypothetical protein